MLGDDVSLYHAAVHGSEKDQGKKKASQAAATAVPGISWNRRSPILFSGQRRAQSSVSVRAVTPPD